MVPIRGVIEGFYGHPWTNPERINLFRFMQQENMNTYVYAPKGDPYQRMDWRLPYPPAKLAQMRTLVNDAKRDHIRFVYSISPGMTGTSTAAVRKSITYSSPSDRKALEAKINQLRSIGVNTFMLSFDDIQTTLKPADQRVDGHDYARAQMQLANEIDADERANDPNFQLWLAPTSYYGLTDGPYWQTLRSTLKRTIKVIWTGKWVLNKSINSAQAKAVTKLIGRKPILWDNYPVNDYTYDVGRRPQLMMGPLQGRSGSLQNNIAGYISNPMIQPYASQLALQTIADYLQDPTGYHPKTAWENAIQHMPGVTNPQLFEAFAAFNTASILNPSGYSPMRSLISAYENASSTSSKNSATKALETEFARLARLPRTLPPTITNKALLHEIQPWLTKLGEEGQGGLDAIAVLQHPSTTNRARLSQQIHTVEASPYKIGGSIITFMQWAKSRR
ncbi:protein O-GlcNAcase [Sulfobacillus harzensis]|nr:protein O-GlcNAcase [Sulfobacillus harzensis]